MFYKKARSALSSVTRLGTAAYHAYKAGKKKRHARSTATSGRKPGSRTTTRTKRKRSNVKVEGAGGQISGFKRTGRIKRFTKQLYKRVSPQFIYANKSNRLFGTAGQQAIQTYYLLDNVAAQPTTDNDFNNMADVANNGELYADTGALGLIYPVKSYSPKTVKYFIDQVTAKYMMTNQENTNVELFIYDLVAKKDGSITPEGAWSGGLTDEGGNASYRNTVGISPFVSPQFNAYWKVLKKTRVVLGTGQSHCHYINWKCQKVFNQEKLADSPYYIKGLSYATMIIQTGLPVTDTTGSTVTTAGTDVASVMTKQVKFKVVRDANQTFRNYFNNLTTPGNAAQQMVDAATGAVENLHQG